MKNLGAKHLVILFILISCSHCQKPILPDLPSPRIVILGPTGSGKSSLANALLGCDPEALDCMFEVCNDMDSCTKNTTWGFGPWLGTGQDFTVVDTPGFGDSNGEDEILIEEMMDILANKVDHADTLLLLLDGLAPRFTASLQTMMQKLTLIFGQIWWDWLVIGVSKWSYSQEEMASRKCYPELLDHKPKCKDEAWFARNINSQMEELFHRNRNFTFVFTDSWSQVEGPPGDNTEDPVQQSHWKEETGILWDITMNRTNVFNFMTIDDILEENARQRAEIKCLNDVITTDISDLKTRVGNNEARVDKNENDIEENKNNMDLLTAAPVGTITAWVTKPSSDSENNSYLPDGWMKCNGDIITSGIWKGKLLPNLNGENRFLRGGDDGEVLTMQDEMVLDHAHIDPGHTHTDNGHYHTQSSHKHRAEGNFIISSGVEHDIRIPTEDFSGSHWYGNSNVYTYAEQPTIQTAYASIHSSKSGVSTVADHYKKGTENRPKNMIVTYIMRVF